MSTRMMRVRFAQQCRSKRIFQFQVLLYLLILMSLVLLYLSLDNSAKRSSPANVDPAPYLRQDERHFAQPDPSSGPARREYPPRRDFSPCPPLFGRVGVFVAYVKSSMETHYAVAQRSLECYLKSGVNYTLFMVDLERDDRVGRACAQYHNVFFRKHCAASVYLKDVDWLVVLDADTAVVNPNHCIEEWIDTRVDLIFYERYFNWEVASGNYIVRNTAYASRFLKRWADWEFMLYPNWHGADNGIHLLQAVIPSAAQEIRVCDEFWRRAFSFDTYMAFVACCKAAFGATRLWPGKVRIYRRAHGWVRDGTLTADAWCEADFMFHGYKAQAVGEDGWLSPFSRAPDPAQCDASRRGWPWRKENVLSVEEIKYRLAIYEQYAVQYFPKQARVIPYLEQPDVAHCYPRCDAMV